MPESCMMCDEPDTMDMVACDECNGWIHFGCAGVSPGVANRDFRCKNCTAKRESNQKGEAEKSLPKPGSTMPDSQNLTQPPASGTAQNEEGEADGNGTTAGGDLGDEYASVVSGASKTQDEFRRLAEQLLKMEEELQEEKLIRERQLEVKRILAEKRLQMERELKKKQLAQEKILLERQLAEEAMFQERQRLLRSKYEREFHELGAADDADQKRAVGGHLEYEGSVGGKSSKIPDIEPYHTRVTQWLSSKMDDKTVGNYDTPKRHPEVLWQRQQPQRSVHGESNDDVSSETTTSVNQTHVSVVRNPPTGGTQNELGPARASENQTHVSVVRNPPTGGTQNELGPTRAQCAARQVLSKKLPTFTGKSEEWPLFYSSFVNSTEACGFTEVENLIRLQESLKGPALEAVRSRLLLPRGVPQVINTLRMLYGRPEQLVHTLLSKVRKTDGPRADRLESFIPFGLAVQEFCDHLEAANLRDHLVNPILLQELIDKLPASAKREWLQFKRATAHPSLLTFADFISRIVADASEVTLEVKVPSNTRAEKPKPKEKGIIHTHSGESAVAPSMPCPICQKQGHRVRNCEDFRGLRLSDRVKLMRQRELCERCLNEHKGWCKFKITCNVGDCRLHHHPLVHHEQASTSRAPSQPPTPTQVQNPEQHHAHVSTKMSVIFRIIPVTLYNGSKSVTTLAYLDEGSSMTLIEDSLVAALGAKGLPQPLTLQWTGNIVRKEPASECLNLQISGVGNKKHFDLTNVRTVKKMHLPVQGVNFQDVAVQYNHLKGLNAAPADRAYDEPKLLIGLNNVYLLAPIESRIGKPTEPIAVRSQLGWTIYGPREISTSGDIVGFHVGLTNEELHDSIREFFVVEEANISVRELPESEADRRAKQLLESTTVRVEGRFETGLLWKWDDFQLPDSKRMALKRLEQLERRLKKNPDIEQNVRLQIEDYQRKGYAHKATPAELEQADPRKIWYLPLNYVANPKKPKRIRLVWDAAAQVEGISLNSMLLTGPDMLTSLPAVIQRFRERMIAFLADIREMFHQCLMRLADKHAQRFLYRTDASSKEPDIFLMDVMTFGAACSPAAAQYIKNLNAAQYAEQFPEAATAIIRRHYVDDYLDSADSVDEAIERAQQVKYIHSQAGFELRRWVSNSDAFLTALGESETEEIIPLNDDKECKTTRVLGIIWCPKQDVFTFSTTLRDDLVPYLTTAKRPTKRIALSCIMCLFDPIGLLAPFTIQGKILIQDLWRTGCDWDQEMDDQTFEKWTQWRSLLPQIEKLKIPRCYLRDAPPEAYKSLEFHVLVDAGEKGYGAVAYFRVETPNGPRCSLVMAKTKVAPLKPLSIPRLELQAAVLGVRLLITVAANHDVQITKRVLWTDSRTVLSWIRSDHRNYKPFVAFRIGEILQETAVDEWRWVPTRMNVADMLTKMGNGSVLDNDSTWFNGPDFLQLPEESWPKQKLPPPNTNEDLRACHMFHDVQLSEPLIDVTRISRWQVVLRTICLVFRFISNCRRRARGQEAEPIEVPAKLQRVALRTPATTVVPLKQEEFERAEMTLWKMAQWESFPHEMKILSKNQRLPKEEWSTIEKTSKLYRLGPFLDEHQVLRMDGRTKLAEMVPYDTRFPIILPKMHPITVHVMEDYHRRFAHGYKETVVNELRTRFHISNVRAAVRKVIMTCQWCKVRKCRPRFPKMAPLPIERVTPFIRPFSYVGVDYFGPVTVTVGRRVEKRWVVVFTCLSVRAIHLEVAHKLDVDSCIMAIRRFVLKRGPPITLFSDNGTNFKAANKELQEQIRRIDTACANVFTNARTRWLFNPPSAPHMGGIWERMVRTVKETMASLLTVNRLNDEILLTVIAEVEEIVNARPLVYMPDDSENPEALTPNHFIRGCSTSLQDPSVAPTDLAEAYRSSYKRSQYTADELWKRWIKEYLPLLNVRTKWLERSEPLKLGDLVFIVDDNGRNGWIRGQIEQVIPGKDGHVRQAYVRTNTGLFRQPLVKLAPIEIQTAGKSVPEVDPGQGLRAGEVLDPLCSDAAVNPSPRSSD